ncbi:MAG TPA: hypothetical protein VNW46_05380 [Gemmatimonadaceae bacterium]|jgi:hypothetical protein|nr:hypothetical protein [Gemmatimonadaceae bacterium]
MPRDTTVVSPLSVAEALDRLRARGREWRESTVPQALRAEHVMHIDVKVEANRFRMLVSTMRRDGAKLGWTGVVIPAQDGQTGCRVVIRPLMTGLVIQVAAIPLVAGWMLFQGAGLPTALTWAILIAVVLGIAYVVRKNTTTDIIDEVLAVLRSTVDAPIPSQPKRFNIDPLQ